MNFKKLVSILLVAACLPFGQVFAAGNFSNLEYGDEWEGYVDSNVPTYKDVPKSHWAFDAIARVSAKNWFSGYPDGSFRPNASIDRKEAMKVFVVFQGLQLQQVEETSFNDIEPEDWYAPYVEAGKDLLPMQVRFDGSAPFQPDMPITREDTIYALVKALGYESETTFADQSVLNMFKDANSISENVKPYVAVAISKGLASGHSNGTIGGQDPLTRAEFASLLYRATYIGSNF